MNSSAVPTSLLKFKKNPFFIVTTITVWVSGVLTHACSQEKKERRQVEENPSECIMLHTPTVA